MATLYFWINFWFILQLILTKRLMPLLNDFNEYPKLLILDKPTTGMDFI